MRAVLADGHPTMRLGLKALLLPTEMCVVGEAGEGEEALRLVEELRPDLVILGLNLTGEVDGVEACCRMKALLGAPHVLVHAAYNHADDVSSCFLAGADGYLHKRAGCEELLEAVGKIVSGERVWEMGGKMGDQRSRLHDTFKGERLTPKEREVVALMLRRCSSAEMVEELCLSLPTVKTHVRNVLRKLGLKSRKELFRSSVSRL